MEAAVIDLGTNTFHLLIARKNSAGDLETIYKERVFVKLAEDGIESIGRPAWLRAVEAMRHFKDIIDKYRIQQITAIGTAALRNAQNAQDLINEIHRWTGIDIDVIDGTQEAKYIAAGVRSIWTAHSQPSLIMDIGGGSVEFIIADQNTVMWITSLPIGVAVLYDRFHQTDPISTEEIRALRSHLRRHFVVLERELNQRGVNRMIGASGTFDVIGDMLQLVRGTFVEVLPEKCSEHLDWIIQSSRVEREKRAEIPQTRVDMIVVAASLIKEVLALNTFDLLAISPYALKEGVIAEALFLD